MFLETYTNAKEFSQEVLPFLLENEPQNCLAIGIVDTLVKSPQVYSKFHLACMKEKPGGKICAAMWQTPPHPLGFATAEPEPALIEKAIKFALSLPVKPEEFVGPARVVKAFTDAWEKRTSGTLVSKMDQLIYKLTKVKPASRAEGQFRVVMDSDKTVLSRWIEAFCVDCHLPFDPGRIAAMTEFGLREKNKFFWEVNGKLVSMAGLSGNTPSGIRVSYVYTPKEARGHGYASALVAALSQRALDSGKKMCFLYTDADNPTSNGIYQKIGYELVGNSTVYRFKYA